MGSEVLLDKKGMSKALQDITEDILQKHSDISNLAIIGIRTRGEFLARRLHKLINTKTNIDVPLGILDINLYRDDFGMTVEQPIIRKTDIKFDISDKVIILVDDVLFTGRTIRAALDALTDLGRPKKIKLLVLIDRGHRELPIQADYVSMKIETDFNDNIQVNLKEVDQEDIVVKN